MNTPLITSRPGQNRKPFPSFLFPISPVSFPIFPSFPFVFLLVCGHSFPYAPTVPYIQLHTLPQLPFRSKIIVYLPENKCEDILCFSLIMKYTMCRRPTAVTFTRVFYSCLLLWMYQMSDTLGYLFLSIKYYFHNLHASLLWYKTINLSRASMGMLVREKTCEEPKKGFEMTSKISIHH